MIRRFQLLPGYDHFETGGPDGLLELAAGDTAETDDPRVQQAFDLAPHCVIEVDERGKWKSDPPVDAAKAVREAAQKALDERRAR